MTTRIEASAIVLAGGRLGERHGKTAHGLIRGPSRFPILAVVDERSAGHDAGEVLDGRRRGIPVVATLREALALGRAAGARPGPATHCILGVATSGGTLPPDLRRILLEAADAGLVLVNGLHQLLAGDAEIAARVRAAGGSIIDVRRPKPVAELRFYTGEVLDLEIPRVAVLGTDCALGKRTTATLLTAELNRRGRRASMIYTGQTGWLLGLDHGLILDATLNDFVCGELEGAILACAAAERPEIIFLEGQSALRNPSGPCGAELLVSAGARTVVLQHAPGRPLFEGFERRGHAVPPLDEELELIRLYGATVVAITLNDTGMEPQALARTAAELEERFAIPVVQPMAQDAAGAAALARVAGAVLADAFRPRGAAG